eukprot:3033535-Amphidinium_carterae.1
MGLQHGTSSRGVAEAVEAATVVEIGKDLRSAHARGWGMLSMAGLAELPVRDQECQADHGAPSGLGKGLDEQAWHSAFKRLRVASHACDDKLGDASRGFRARSVLGMVAVH